jgi:ATP-dependent helicase HrpB
LQAAELLLKRLSALDDNGVTELGRRMLQFPVHPRQARIILAAEARGAVEAGCLLAALIGERDIRLAARVALTERSARKSETGPSDLLLLADLFHEAERAQFAPYRLRDIGLDPGATQSVDRVRRQLIQSLRSQRANRANPAELDKIMMISALAGYPDRVARCRLNANGRIELLFAGGGSAQLAASSVMRSAEFAVAIDAEQRESSTYGVSKNISAQVSVASQIEPDWLLELFLDAITETSEMIWHPEAERVELVKRLLYDQMVIEESRGQIIDRAAAAKILFEAARMAGWRAFVKEEELTRWLARYKFVAETFPEAAFASIEAEALTAALSDLCQNRTSFAQLREAAQAGELLDILQKHLTGEQRRLLHTMAPERLTLPGGRSAKIEYEAGKAPWLASRLQDFFGMAKGPTIAGGRVALVLHLLAPNQRPVQVTTDLAGFWARAYQQVRKELSRRYPRHSWPDNPLQAAPPGPSNRPKIYLYLPADSVFAGAAFASVLAGSF